MVLVAGMSAILDHVDQKNPLLNMTVELPRLMRQLGFLLLLLFCWNEKRLLLFFWKEKRLLLFFDIDKILDAGRQNLTKMDPVVALCWTYSSLLNIIGGVIDAEEPRFIDLPLDIEIKMVLLGFKMVLLVMAMFSRSKPLKSSDPELWHMFLGVLKEAILSFVKLITTESSVAMFWTLESYRFQILGLGLELSLSQNLGLGLELSLSQNEWLDFIGTYLKLMISVLLIMFQWIWIYLTGLVPVSGEDPIPGADSQRENGQVEEEDTSFTNAQRENGQVEEDTSFTNAQRENGQVEEEDRSFINAQRVFKKETLVAATNNFHDDNKLGEGGFGTVYKGTHDGKQIAVKQLLSTSDRGRKEFLNEKLLAKIQHRNIVNLLGCCKEGSQMFVVYEYLRNGSLDKFLSDAEKRKGLDWQKRYNIILGIARALRYLHEDIEPPIVHRDIKASNILLDEKLNPKIADFGTAKQLPEDKTHVSTGLVGTFGHMAPEYAMEGRLSVIADVYSFGVVLLELITGKRISSEMGLLGSVWRSYKQGKSVRTIDQAIIGTCHKKQALRCIHIGLLCTQDNALLRPPMSQVTVMLSTPAALPVPTKPPLSHEIHERGCCDIQ